MQLRAAKVRNILRQPDTIRQSIVITALLVRFRVAAAIRNHDH